jgi:hypothetical protein
VHAGVRISDHDERAPELGRAASGGVEETAADLESMKGHAEFGK